MGKIDINELKKSTELKESEPAETKAKSEELIDNASEPVEDINEIKEEPEAEKEEKESGKVIVRYAGNGTWKDSKGKLWANMNKSKDILAERQFSKEEYETREDIKFMVSYGAMIATEVE